jgi:isoquinoline 1-oxidoreductase alpha subunit
VIVDGRAATSCNLTIAAVEGSNITTIEGLSSDRAHPVQQAWAVEQVSQCGFCDPGFIMAIAALLQASPNPSAAQIDALPNLCPCGAYPRIRKAILRAAQAMGGAAAIAAAPPEELASPTQDTSVGDPVAPQAVVPEANRFIGG